MRKIILLFIATLSVCLILTGCKSNEPEHQHDYNYSVTLTDPTDKERGYITRSCYCGETAVSMESFASEGILYRLNSDNTYAVTGIYNCDDRSLVIPSHYEGLPVVEIADGAFRDSSGLVEIIIPATVTKIGHLGLGAYLNFSDIHVNPSNQHYTSISGVLYTKDTKTLVQYPAGRDDTSFEVPSHVSEIGGGAFYSATNLTAVTVPEGVTSIGDDAFRDCRKITEVKLPGTLTKIGSGAFFGCYELKTANVSSSVTFIGEKAFYHCENLESVNIPSGVQNIGDMTFAYCYKLKSVVLPDSVVSIGKNAFEWCDELVSVSFGSGLETIGEYAFSCCKSLKSVILPASLSSLGAWAFSWCDELTGANIPSKMHVIEDCSFYMCKSLKNIDIPTGIVSIGDMAFYECEKLETVSIPSTVSYIGTLAFAACTSLTDIDVSKDNRDFASLDGSLYTYDGKILMQYALGRDDVSFTVYAFVEKIADGAFYQANNLLGVSFEYSNGWHVNEHPIDAEILADPERAAYYLTSYYCRSEWLRG